MSRFTNRVPAIGKEGRIKIKNVVTSGNEITGILEHADDATVQGTLLNADNLNRLEADLKAYTDNACSGISGNSPTTLPITGGHMLGSINMMAQNLEFQGNDPGDIIWFDAARKETDRIWAPAVNRSSLHYRRNGGTEYCLLHNGNVQDFSYDGNYVYWFGGTSQTGNYNIPSVADYRALMFIGEGSYGRANCLVSVTTLRNEHNSDYRRLVLSTDVAYISFYYVNDTTVYVKNKSMFDTLHVFGIR